MENNVLSFTEHEYVMMDIVVWNIYKLIFMMD